MKLAWARYEGDDRARLTSALCDSFARGDVVLSFGGVGATPDDHTRQAAALALELPLVRHAEAVASIEARFGDAAYPYRVLMAEFPQGASIIPNPVNGIASFSMRDHHFFPGFPEMAWPMLEWVLDTHYGNVQPVEETERAIVVHGAGESQLLPIMQENVERYPMLRLFSLPAFLPDGGRRLELGVRGDAAHVEEGIRHLIDGVSAAGFAWEPLPPRAAP